MIIDHLYLFILTMYNALCSGRWFMDKSGGTTNYQALMMETASMQHLDEHMVVVLLFVINFTTT